MNVDFSIWPTLCALIGRSSAIAGAVNKNLMTEKQGIVFNALDMTVSCIAIKSISRFGMEINASNLFLARMLGFTSAFVITTLAFGEFSIAVAAAMSVSAVAWGYLCAPNQYMSHFFLNNPL
jgi:hypothetical protein